MLIVVHRIDFRFCGLCLYVRKGWGASCLSQPTQNKPNTSTRCVKCSKSIKLDAKKRWSDRTDIKSQFHLVLRPMRQTPCQTQPSGVSFISPDISIHSNTQSRLSFFFGFKITITARAPHPSPAPRLRTCPLYRGTSASHTTCRQLRMRPACKTSSLARRLSSVARSYEGS